MLLTGLSTFLVGCVPTYEQIGIWGPVHDLMWGPLAALTAESFTPRLRYSGASIGFQLAAMFAGGPAPMIATAILASTGSGQMIALYIFGCAIVSVAATAFLPSSRDRDFTRDHL